MINTRFCRAYFVTCVITAHFMYLSVISCEMFAGNPCSSDSPLDLSEYSGRFTSTHYPANYSDGSDCQWRLTAIEGNGVTALIFMLYFVLYNANIM